MMHNYVFRISYFIKIFPLDQVKSPFEKHSISCSFDHLTSDIGRKPGLILGLLKAIFPLSTTMINRFLANKNRCVYPQPYIGENQIRNQNDQPPPPKVNSIELYQSWKRFFTTPLYNLKEYLKVFLFQKTSSAYLKISYTYFQTIGVFKLIRTKIRKWGT